MSSLTLPVPVQLDDNMDTPSGRLQDSYRRPWCGSVGTLYKLEHTGSVVDYLKAELHPVDRMERFIVCAGDLEKDVVLSSNLASPRCLNSQEALCLLNRGEGAAGQEEWTESFTEVDVHSICFSEQDLFLPEEVLFSDNWLKSHLPSLPTLLKRLKPYPVPDLLDLHQTGSPLIEDFSPYSCVWYDAAASCSTPPWGIDEFRNETILDAEDLKLPDFIETDFPQKQELLPCHLVKLQEALKLSPEPDEEPISVLDTLRRGMETSPEWERFSAPLTDITDSAAERVMSPFPFSSYVELEMDLILSPLAPPPPPASPDWKDGAELFQYTVQLSAETLSPVHRVLLLSDSEREVLEKGVWVAEKHPPCPRRPAPPVTHHTLPDLLSSLQAEPEPDDLVRSHFISLLQLMTPDPILKQALTIETHTAVNTLWPEVTTTDQFTPLSLSQIDVHAASPVVERKATQTTVPAGVRESKTATFLLEDHDSLEPNRNKDSARSKSSPASCHPSTGNTQTSDMSENTAKRLSLLKSGLKPAPYHYSVKNTHADKSDPSVSKTQENSQKSGSLMHSVRGPYTNTSRLKSLHTAAHKLLTTDNQIEMTRTVNNPNGTSYTHTFSENATLQKRSFRLQGTHTPNDSSKPLTMRQNSGVTPTLSRPACQREERTPHPAPRSSSGRKNRRSSVCRPQEYLDPVTSFMMLRGVLRSTVEQKPEVTPLSSTELSQKSTLKPTDCSGRRALQQATEMKTGDVVSPAVPERSFCKTVHVPPTDTERGAYRELHALACPVLYRVTESGALRHTDFSNLTPEHTRFCLKQQEKMLSAGHGRECVYNDVGLLHILVTLKELLLRCDLNTATGHLEKAYSTCTMGGLGELLRKFQVLQYLSRKWMEPQLRVKYLQEQIHIWLQRTSVQKILIVVAVDNVRAELVMALGQIPGNSVAALDSRVDSRSLTDSRCSVVCVQHLQCGFPWGRFGAVFEFQSLGDWTVRRICMKNKIHYTCFTTAAAACTEPVYSSPLDRVPFVLFITEGLLKHCDLLQLMESTYNMTLLERIHCPSLQQLGPTDLYDIITVDENTAILLQELVELEQERAAERVVLRLSALSLQFSRCWVILHCSGHYSSLVCGEVFSNLLLIYSAAVLFGQKTDRLDVKVLLAYNVADVAHCVQQVCFHTILNSRRDVCSWLERQWFSVLLTEEEQCLLYFPCVNCVVAQLLLSRSLSLQWLLEASHTQLEELFPEISPSVLKWTLEASSLMSSLSFSHSLTVPCSPFTQNPPPPLSPPLIPHLSHQQWGGMGYRPEQYTGRKRPVGGAVHTVFPQSKRGRLLFERVPGRSDGQTRLRFF
ncbi:hypothetical protein KOW79_018455 [Hemibagrus wyckioides]|uniref:Protein shortage in chiasmata 1 ortholog n=1 Tax=Hemibagrus wyckioides TaxID=337641 RepID=A0A9D3NAQ8_9TELE|nr:hypothetical protein KOW79_018455 [Hemibagrus wyckioides]